MCAFTHSSLRTFYGQQPLEVGTCLNPRQQCCTHQYVFPQHCNSISNIQLNGILDHKQLPTFSPTTRQWLGTHQCVCKCDKFVVPMWNSFYVVTLIDQRHKISGCQSHGVPNSIWEHLIFGDPQHGGCFMSTFWHLNFWGGAYNFGEFVEPLYTSVQICECGHY
jgi:hypothetical protein